MNKFVFFSIFIYFSSFAQITKVTYGNVLPATNGETFAKVNPQSRKMILSLFENLSKLTYELIYSNSESIYTTINDLGLPNTDESFSLLPRDIYYVDKVNKEKIFNTTQLGENINVLKEYNDLNWLITKETKDINGFKCIKATSTKLDSFNPIKNSSALINYIVWFTPAIPTNFGPEAFGNLPGLILEASGGGKHICATKIEFDVKNSKLIEKPKAAKLISSDEYDKMITDNLQRIKDEMGN